MRRASGPEPLRTASVWAQGLGARLWILGQRLGPLVVLLGLALFAAEAAARVGGGQGYRGGGGSSGGGGGGWSGGGGSSGDGDFIFLLIWLCFEFPCIGIPLLIAVVVFFLYTKGKKGGASRPSPGGGAPALGPAGRGATVTRRSPTAELQQRDPNFSEPLFVDFVQLVYARAQELRPQPEHPLFAALMTPKARRAHLQGSAPDAVEAVIFGATRIAGVSLQSEWALIRVDLETNFTERRGGRSTDFLGRETWVFRRAMTARSPGPEGMRALSCPSCGSTLEPRTDGTCPNCDTLRTDGQLQWQVHELSKVSRQPLPPLRPQPGGGGMESGLHRPTVVDGALQANRRKLAVRHPEFSWPGFEGRVRLVFGKLQEAWSNQRWEEARPYETDALFSVHRFWIEHYREAGFVNRLGDIQVQQVVVVKVGLDAWVETITVRVYASMKDWTETLPGPQEAGGRVVGGDPRVPRQFSEYWTFVRTVNGRQPDPRAADGEHCPSCGAPLDNVSMAGVCGYCDSKITTGDYDWVLSRIEQDEAYGG